METASAASASLRIMYAFCNISGRNWVHPCRAAQTRPMLIATAGIHLQAAIYGHLASLQGRAIPQLLASGDVGYDTGNSLKFLATKHVGRSVLQAQLQKEDVDTALCSLRHVHDMGVLHGDVHLDNVVLNEEASDTTAASAICCECPLQLAIQEPSSRPRKRDTDGRACSVAPFLFASLHRSRDREDLKWPLNLYVSLQADSDRCKLSVATSLSVSRPGSCSILRTLAKTAEHPALANQSDMCPPCLAWHLPSSLQSLMQPALEYTCPFLSQHCM